MRDPIKKMSIIRSLLPHPFHFGRTRLEVPEILFAEAGFLEDFDFVAGEGGGGGVVGGEGPQDAFGGFAGAAVGRGEELEGVVWFEHGAEAAACFFCL